jgi:hypothetical protein
MNNSPELFSDFEVYKYSRAPIMMKLLGASLAVHIAFLTAVAVSPALQDMLFIASFFSDTEFVDKAYKKSTIIEEVGLIIDVKNEKFAYPQGYFAMFEKPKVVQTIAVKPKPKPTPKPKPKTNVQTAKNKKAETKDEANKDQTDTAAQVNDDHGPVEFNKRPLKDFGADVKAMVEKGKLDLEQPFEIVISGSLNAKGRLVNPRYRVVSGSKEMTKVVANLALAMNDSGLLAQFVKANDGKPLSNLIFRAKRDAASFVVTVESKVDSPQVAGKISSALGLAFLLVRKARAGKDEAILLSNTSASAKGSSFVVNFKMSSAQADALINRQLALAKQDVGK